MPCVEAFSLDGAALFQYCSAMTMRIAAKLHFNRGLDFIYLNDSRLPLGFPEHSHDYIETVIAIEGRGIHRVNGHPYETTPGDVCVIQGNSVHCFEHTSPDFRIINVMHLPDKVCFPLELLRKMPGYQALFVMEPAQRSEGEFKARLKLSDVALSGILTLSRRMEEELSAKRDGFESALHALLLEMVVTLSREYSKSSELGARRMLRMGEAIAWMEANYASKVSLPELAKRAALSERQFLRIFRKAFGVPPLERLLEIRVKAAAEMLKDGSVPVSEAAFACGFNDSNYFCKQFKRFYGSAPKRYALAARGERTLALPHKLRQHITNGAE